MSSTFVNEKKRRRAAEDEEEESGAYDEEELIRLAEEDGEDQVPQLESSTDPNASASSSHKRSYLGEEEEKKWEEELLSLSDRPVAPSSSSSSSSSASSSFADSPPQLSCESCHQLAYNSAYQKAFHISVCNSCMRAYPARYKLVTKTQARADYFVKEDEFKDMKFMLKSNPNKGSWAQMKLYQLCDIVEVAKKKFLPASSSSSSKSSSSSSSSPPAVSASSEFNGREFEEKELAEEEANTAALHEALTAEKQRRELERMNRNVAKRKQARQSISKEVKIRNYDAEAEKKKRQGHVHDFKDDGGGKQVCKECKFVLEYEEL